MSCRAARWKHEEPVICGLGCSWRNCREPDIPRFLPCHPEILHEGAPACLCLEMREGQSEFPARELFVRTRSDHREAERLRRGCPQTSRRPSCVVLRCDCSVIGRSVRTSIRETLAPRRSAADHSSDASLVLAEGMFECLFLEV